MISVKVKGEKKQLAPEEVSSMVLTKMKEIAEAYLGKEVRSPVCLTHSVFCFKFTIAQTCVSTTQTRAIASDLPWPARYAI